MIKGFDSMHAKDKNNKKKCVLFVEGTFVSYISTEKRPIFHFQVEMQPPLYLCRGSITLPIWKLKIGKKEFEMWVRTEAQVSRGISQMFE